jgi:hypothetical protein
MSLKTTLVVGALVATANGAPAQVPMERVQALAEIDRNFVRLGKLYGESIWPGYRPDTIPIAYVFPELGTALFNWRGALPANYETVPGIPTAAWVSARNLGAASTGTLIGDRAVAQVVVSALAIEAVLPTAFHEAFHVFERASQRPGSRFGGGENSFFVASYPIFDLGNELLWSLEGRLLNLALQEKSAARKRQLAGEFVAVRRRRQSLLDPSYAEFERASEMNEGLAEYALVRALQLLAADSLISAPTRGGARTILADRVVNLARLTGNLTQSFRLRFYQTGPAEALLLDAIAPGWKTELMKQNQTIQDALAISTGLDDPQRTAFRNAVTRIDTAIGAPEVATRVANLVALRRRQVDSVLAAPGILLEISASVTSGKDFNVCGFDPQNHLQVSPTVQMQTRWWRPCAGSSFTSEFNVPSVHDDSTGTVRAIIGPISDVKLTIDGVVVTLSEGRRIDNATNVRLEAPRANVQVSRANVSFNGRTLRIAGLP